jgi:hypothetical protein
MVLRRLPLVIALLLLTATAASAQLTFERNPNKDPYRNLFGERDRDEKTKLPARVISRETRRSRSLCAVPSSFPLIRTSIRRFGSGRAMMASNTSSGP